MGWWGVNVGAARRHTAPPGLPGTVPTGALLLGSVTEAKLRAGPIHPVPGGRGSQEGMARSWLHSRLGSQFFRHWLWRGVAWWTPGWSGAWLERKVDRPLAALDHGMGPGPSFSGCW